MPVQALFQADTVAAVLVHVLADTVAAVLVHVLADTVAAVLVHVLAHPDHACTHARYLSRPA
jgi:hypothetical protein